MNPLLTLTLLCLLSVGQILGQFQPSAGDTSLQGSVTGGVSNANPNPTRWIEFMDMDNDWSKLGSTFTVEAWIWHSNTALSSWQPILSRHSGAGAPRQQAHFSIAVRDNSNLEVTAGCGCNSNGQECGNGFLLLASGQTFATQTWEHVAVTFSGDGTNSTATLYLGGSVVATSTWGAQDVQCQGRTGQWARYADVSVGFMDDQAANPFGWTGRIDEIRFWQGVRSVADIRAFHDVGLKGHESGLFAYYTFNPSQELLQDPTAPKEIRNEVGNRLHGLPQPNPTDSDIFSQSSTLRINTYADVEGQSGLDSDLPPLPNQVEFNSWPETNSTVYSVVPGKSPALQALIDAGIADIYGNPSDLTSVTVFVTCPGNDCSNYTTNWKNYYFNYTATNGAQLSSATVYLRIVTACPSGVFDSCGTCEGDNSQCQCVVYHGFETQRMSFILFEWSLDNLINEIEAGRDILSDTLEVLDAGSPSNAVLRQQIFELMGFYNEDLTNYCGDLSSFMTELEGAIPRPPEALIDASATIEDDAVLPYIPAFPLPPSSV